jgi:hypothetical protein
MDPGDYEIPTLEQLLKPEPTNDMPSMEQVPDWPASFENTDGMNLAFPDLGGMDPFAPTESNLAAANMCKCCKRRFSAMDSNESGDMLSERSESREQRTPEYSAPFGRNRGGRFQSRDDGKERLRERNRRAQRRFRERRKNHIQLLESAVEEAAREVRQMAQYVQLNNNAVKAVASTPSSALSSPQVPMMGFGGCMPPFVVPAATPWACWADAGAKRNAEEMPTGIIEVTTAVKGDLERDVLA